MRGIPTSLTVIGLDPRENLLKCNYSGCTRFAGVSQQEGGALVKRGGHPNPGRHPLPGPAISF